MRAQSRPDLRLRSKSFLLLLRGRGDDAPSRVGIVASRKVGGAVQRNRAKRLIRELFRAHKAIFGVGVDAVFIVTTSPAGLTRAGVEAELLRLSSEVQRGVRRLAEPGRKQHAAGDP